MPTVAFKLSNIRTQDSDKKRGPLGDLLRDLIKRLRLSKIGNPC